ncbi:MAG: AccI family restriction endonuclease [Verrucomicrobiae bacterium]|nr:AccI family restriction endonuclease [Verrucomicrobiae bacterium]
MSKLEQAHHPFEKALTVCCEDLQEILLNYPALPWLDFWLNPRRLRGSDFLMRWSQGVWSEHRLIEAVGETGKFFAIPYGPSGTAPTGSVREFELYFERLEAAGLGKVKRPDLLIFLKEDRKKVEGKIAAAGGLAELPFIPETDPRIAALLADALVAVECENSLWRGVKMPDFQTPLRPQKRLGGKLGLKKGAVLPTIIIKEEDRRPLLQWQKLRGVPIHIWHVFYDRAYGLSFDRAEKLIREKLTEATVQTFQAPGGATTKKAIYKHYYHYGYPVGISIEDPKLLPAFVEDKNGHILPYVTFSGGHLSLLPESLEQLRLLAAKRE